MRSFICKLVYWIMLKLYVFILWALLPLLTMGKGILIQNVVIFDGKSEKTVTGNVWIEDNVIRKVSAYGYVNKINGEHHIALVKGDIADCRVSVGDRSFHVQFLHQV